MFKITNAELVEAVNFLVATDVADNGTSPLQDLPDLYPDTIQQEELLRQRASQILERSGNPFKELNATEYKLDLQNKDRKAQVKAIHKAIQNVEAMIDIMDTDKHDGRDLVKFCLKYHNGFAESGKGKHLYACFGSAGELTEIKKMLNECRERTFTDRVQDEALSILSKATLRAKTTLQFRYHLLANKNKQILREIQRSIDNLTAVRAAMEKIFILEQTGAPQDRGIEHFLFNDFVTVCKQLIEDQLFIAKTGISWAQILKTRCAVAGNFTPASLKISKMRNSKCHWQTLWHNTHLFQEQLVALIPNFWKSINEEISCVARTVFSSWDLRTVPQVHALIAFHLETTGTVSDEDYAVLNDTALPFAAFPPDVKVRVELILGTVDRMLFFHNKQQRVFNAFNVVHTSYLLQFAFEAIQDNLGDKFTTKDVGGLFARWKLLIAPDFLSLLTSCMDVLGRPTEYKFDVYRFIWQQTESTALYYLHTNQEEKAIHFIDAFNDIVPRLMEPRGCSQGKNKRKKRFPKTVLPELKEELRKLKELQLQQEQQQLRKHNTAELSKNARKRLLYKQQRALEEKYAVDLSNVVPSIGVSKKELEQNHICHEERVQRKAALKAARANNNNNSSNDCSINNDNEQVSEQNIKPTYFVTKKEYEIFEGIINYSTKISSESAQFKSLMFKIFNMQFRQAKGSHCVGVSTGIRLPDLIDVGNGNIIPLSSFSAEIKNSIILEGGSNATWITTCSKLLRKYQLRQIRKSMFERGWTIDTVAIGK